MEGQVATRQSDPGPASSDAGASATATVVTPSAQGGSKPPPKPANDDGFHGLRGARRIGSGLLGALMKRAHYIVPALILLGGVTLRVFDPVLIEQTRNIVYDTYQRIQPRTYVDAPVKIIDLDDTSLEKLGQWPWPRSTLADMVARLTNAGAAAIAFDIVFAEPDRTAPARVIPEWGGDLPELQALKGKLDALPDPDKTLAEIFQHPAVPAVTGFVLNNGAMPRVPKRHASFAQGGDDPRLFVNRYPGAVANLTELEAAAKGNGSFNMVPDTDGVVRRVPFIMAMRDPSKGPEAGLDQWQLYPSLSAETLRVAQGASTYIVKSSGASGEGAFGAASGIIAVRVGNFEVPTDSKGQVWVHYTDFRPDRYLPAWKIFEPDFDPKTVEGQLLLVGTSAAGLLDLRATPLNPVLPGVEVHAQLMEQVITQHFLTRPDWATGLEVMVLLVFGVILIILLPRVSTIFTAILTLAAVALAIGVSWYAYDQLLLLLDPIYPSLIAILIYASSSLIMFLRTEADKAQVRQAFGMYLSPAMVELLAENPQKLELGGEMRTMSIMFMDVRGFTTISEQFDAVGLTRFMNRFLTPMTRVILENKGTIDKYMGDCIMAFWNAPLDDPEHGKNAARSALRMINARDELNARLKEEAAAENRKYIPLNIGIGINTGRVCVGNMGSDQRFDYSVLGDDVNLASRLEGQSKGYHCDTVIGENTEEHLRDDFALLELDLIKVKGKTKPVRIFSLLGDKTMKDSEEFKKLKTVHEAMLQAYRNMQWDACDKLLVLAKQLGRGMVHDDFYDLYAERVHEYREHPPVPAGETWDGVYTATSK